MSALAPISAVLLFLAAACGEPPVPIPDFEPFSELDGDLHFGDPARVVAARPRIAVNDGGPLFRITRAEFAGSPAFSVGAEIDFEEDGEGYEASLIVSAAGTAVASDIEAGFARHRVECEALPGGVR